MTEARYDVVQFVHPGFEYHRQEHVGSRRIRAGVMSWKPGNAKHDRKFMVSRGSLIDYQTGEHLRSVAFTFWGEWEGPSAFWKVESPGKPLPRVIHAPFLPSTPPVDSVQNTDPMVFGDAFFYSNCLQKAFRSLRELKPGSIVLFGRYGRTGGVSSFALDTCLVVNRAEPLMPRPFDPALYGRELVDDAVSCPLNTEGAEESFIAYYGQTPTTGSMEPFSFFPARLMLDAPPLFARPVLRPVDALHGIVNSGKMQGIKVTPGLKAAERAAIWDQVAKQVANQGCELGYQAPPPPLLEHVDVESAVQMGPAPINI
jgi:hypothetical protein